MQNLMRLWPLLCCYLVVLVGCTKDAVVAEPADGHVPAKSSCLVHLSYEAETTTIFKLVNGEDASRLTPAEQALMLPERKRQEKQFCLQSDGNYVLQTDWLTPAQPIEFPANTAGVWAKPKYPRSVNENGIVSYYNAEGEKLDEDYISATPTHILSLINAFQIIEAYPVTEDDDQLLVDMLAAWEAEGYSITAHGDQVITLSHTAADGLSSVVMIDKHARMQVGQLSTDADGLPLGGFVLQVSGRAPNVSLEKMLQFTYYQSVVNKVPMLRKTITDFHSFELSL